MWVLADERLLCPEEFQARLVSVGGLNRYDEPNFKAVWGNTHTIRTAGWKEYRDTLMGFGDNSWMLLQWVAPELLGTPESWYVTNVDEVTGMCLLCEYPYSGNYKLLFNLSHRYVENGSMKVFRFPLSELLLNTIVPLVMEAKNVTLEQNKAWWLAQEEARETNIERMIEQIRVGKRLAFRGGSVSFTNQGVRTSSVDQRTQALARGWAEASARLQKAGLGFQQGNI